MSPERFRALFAAGEPVRIAGIGERLGVQRAAVTRLMRRHGTLTSINRDAAYCVLPTMCRFDSLGFGRLGPTVFFAGGTQLDAIVRLVEESEQGLETGPIAEAVGSKVGMQVLHLVRAGRLRREKRQGRYVYYAGDAQRAARQQEARCARQEQEQAREGAAAAAAAADPERELGRFLAEESRENVELLVKVLATCLRHPRFSAKSVALSLVRRGERTSTEQVREFLERFALRGKNS